MVSRPWLLRLNERISLLVSRHFQGATPLITAVHQGHIGVVECLCQFGIHVNVEMSNGAFAKFVFFLDHSRGFGIHFSLLEAYSRCNTPIVRIA